MDWRYKEYRLFSFLFLSLFGCRSRDQILSLQEDSQWWWWVCWRARFSKQQPRSFGKGSSLKIQWVCSQVFRVIFLSWGQTLCLCLWECLLAMRLIKLLIADQLIILYNRHSNPALHHFCTLCRKQLTNSVRILAKIQDTADQYRNFCPPCLCNKENPYSIQEYLVCQRLNQPLPGLANLTAEDILHTLSHLHQKGIQGLTLESDDPDSNRSVSNYQRMNEQIFKDLGIGLELVSVRPESEWTDPEKASPANKKHLKALGYNWERQEFSSQLDTLFGFLLGNLESREEQTPQDRKLRHTIFKYYEKEMDTLNSVSKFLVDSTFLLGRKGLHEMAELPPQILLLRQLEEDIKDIITSVTAFVSKVDQPATSAAPSREQCSKDQEEQRQSAKRHSRLTESGERYKPRDRSRSRDKKGKDRKDSGWEQQQNLRKEGSREQQGTKNGNYRVDGQGKGSSVRAGDSGEPVKRRRGRPRGSKNRPKDLGQEEKIDKGVLKSGASMKKEQLSQKKELKRMDNEVF